MCTVQKINFIADQQKSHVRVCMTKKIINFKINKMKNLKKISRENLKNLFGGKLDPNNNVFTISEDGVEKTYRCCERINVCGGCGYSSNCPSGKFLQGCS